MKAKKILKTLDYLPRWAWYLLSFFVGGPFGILGVYLLFHVLKKMEKEQSQAEQEAAHSRFAGSYADQDCVVTSDENVTRQWEKSNSSSKRTEKQPKAETFNVSENSSVSEVIRAGYDAMRQIRSANDIIADELLSSQIDSIENSCAQILSILEQRPQLLSQLRSFLRYRCRTAEVQRRRHCCRTVSRMALRHLPPGNRRICLRPGHARHRRSGRSPLRSAHHQRASARRIRFQYRTVQRYTEGEFLK